MKVNKMKIPRRDQILLNMLMSDVIQFTDIDKVNIGNTGIWTVSIRWSKKLNKISVNFKHVSDETI